jgi:hypothetical protein
MQLRARDLGVDCNSIRAGMAIAWSEDGARPTTCAAATLEFILPPPSDEERHTDGLSVDARLRASDVVGWLQQ